MTIAISGTTGITLAGQFDSASTFGFKNRIINGGMVIDQRNAGAEVNPAVSGSYYLDRWSFSGTVVSKIKIGQNAGSVTPPTGFTNYLGVTSLSAYSVSASDLFILRHKIEGFNFADLAWGTASAATATLSFWVRSSLTGTFGASISNSASNYSYPFSYSIPTANTWTYITTVVAGPTAGTWIGATNGIGCQLKLSLGVGSTYNGTAGAWAAADYISVTGATSVVGTNGATFYITGVQLEKGSIATSFDVRPYGTELALCQRYYEKTYNMSAVPGTNVGPNTGEWVGVAINGSDFYSFGYGICKVSKRASPTMVIYSTDGTVNTFRQQDASNVTAAVRFASENGFSFSGSGMATNNYLRGHWTSSAEL